MKEDGKNKSQGISRRDFIALSSAGIAGAIIVPGLPVAAGMMGGSGGGGMGGGGGGMGGGTTVIDPPAGPAFANPPDAVMTRTGNIVEVELDVRETVVNVNGTNARLMTYNGLYPGPTIRARKNDILRIHHTNSLPATTQTNLLGHTRNVVNLHTHGLHVTPEPPGDYMGIMLAPGEDYQYEYDLMYEEPGHLNLYHPHVHGTVAEQYWAGLMGALLIEDDTDALAAYETDRKIMVLKDITISGGLPAPHSTMMDYMHGKEGATVVMNGMVNPLVSIKPGQVQRWQIVNGCNARFFMLSLEGHSMYLVGTDSGLANAPYRISKVLLSPGERVDILVKASRTKGRYRLLSLPYNRGGMSQAQQVTLMTMEVKGSATNGSLPITVNPLARRLDMDTSMLPRRTITLSMMQGRGYINGISFTDMENCYKLMSDLETYEVWEIINDSGMDHPFHQHVNACQVLSINGGDAGYASLYTGLPVMKDVVVIPKWGSVTMLVPVKHWKGMGMFHCHIIEHEDIGMMGMWHIMESGMPM